MSDAPFRPCAVPVLQVWADHSGEEYFCAMHCESPLSLSVENRTYNWTAGYHDREADEDCPRGEAGSCLCVITQRYS